MHESRGYRNRIVLEILYDTAIRRQEICNIKISDIDLDEGYVHIRGGKGNKDRVHTRQQTRVCDLIGNYILAVRPAFIKGKDDGYLILNRWGKKDGCNGHGHLVHRQALCPPGGIDKNVSPHTFRHTCATHMLKNGAPVRHIQEMLGQFWNPRRFTQELRSTIGRKSTPSIIRRKR